MLTALASCTPADGPEDTSLPGPPEDVEIRSLDKVHWTHGAPARGLGRVDLGALRRAIRTDVTHTIPDTELNATVAVKLPGVRQARRVAALVRSSLSAGDSHYRPRDAVVAVGSVVVVRGLGTRAGMRRVERTLEENGGRAQVQDWSRDRHISADMTCRPATRDRVRDAARDLADASSLPPGFHARAPWVGPPLTDAERLARSTYRRLATAQVEGLQQDETFIRLGLDYVRHLEEGDREAAARDQDGMAARARELAGRPLDGEVDLRVLALMAESFHWSTDPQDLDLAEVRDWQQRMGALMGQHPLTGDARSNRDGWVFAVRLRDRLALAGFGSEAFLPAWASLLTYLDRHDCEDVRIRLTPGPQV